MVVDIWYDIPVVGKACSHTPRALKWSFQNLKCTRYILLHPCIYKISATTYSTSNFATDVLRNSTVAIFNQTQLYYFMCTPFHKCQQKPIYKNMIFDFQSRGWSVTRVILTYLNVDKIISYGRKIAKIQRLVLSIIRTFFYNRDLYFIVIRFKSWN